MPGAVRGEDADKAVQDAASREFVWDNGRIVERPPVDFGTPAAGGGGSSTTLDPSIGFSDGTVRVGPPKVPTDLVGQWTENSRTVAMPDGTYQLSVSPGRLNYKDGAGTWRQIDLSLVQDGAGGLRTTANDRSVAFGVGNAEAKLASLSFGDGMLTIRALDFPSTSNALVGASGNLGGDTKIDAPGQAGTPATSAAPEQSPLPSPSPDTSRAPVASPAPETSAPQASEAPAITPQPQPSDSPAPSPTPTAIPEPGSVVAPSDGVISFTKDESSGQIFVRPTDTGFEFGATLANPGQANAYAFAVDLGSLQASIATDGHTILLSRATTTSEGKASLELVGSISAPIVVDADDVPAPVDGVKVSLIQPGSSEAPGISASARAGLGKNEAVLVYTIDRSWLETRGRTYPVTLDPTACLGEGASGCDLGSGASNFDHFVMSGLPTLYPINWTAVRVGDDSITTDNNEYNNMRGMFYFQDIALPDGAVVYDTDLQLHVSSIHGSTGETVTVYRINKSWSQTSTWNSWNSGAGYDGSGPTATDTVASGYMHWDVDGIVQSWYTRRTQDWKSDIGFAVKQNDESDGAGETMFDRYNDPTPGYRPLLKILYEQAGPKIDFDSKLGVNYSPSTMLAGQPTTLPIVITNAGPTDFSTGLWKVGYRFLDAKGAVAASNSQLLTQCIGAGAGCVTTSATIPLAVTPPSTIGQYTLRLDMVRMTSNLDQWASDYAKPSMFYARNKKVLSADNTRWTGTSLVERDEFSIAVVDGVGRSGSVKTVPLGDGSTVSIDLWSKNLVYAGRGGEGFSDLIALGLDYRYQSKNLGDCTGILKACGWTTNYDERFRETGGGGGTTFTYLSPDGNRYLVDNDADQQLVSGAPVLLQRQRATLFDEQVPSVCCTDVSLVLPSGESPSFAPVSGAYVLRTKYTLTTAGYKDLGFNRDTNLNTFRNARFGIRTNTATSAAVGFKITNVTTGSVNWFVYTFGPSSWSAGDDYVYVGTLNSGAWTYASRNLYTDVRDTTTFGGETDEYRVDDMRIYFKAGLSGTNYTYLDAMRLEPDQTTILDDSNPAGDWTSNSSLATPVSGDQVSGTAAIKVTSAALGSSPDCQIEATTSCWDATSGKLWSYGFVHWQWKKVGGNQAAVVFHLKDDRTGTQGDLTYYAGPIAPAGAVNAIRIADNVPSDWSKVTVNLLQDARQVLGFYKDSPDSSSPSSPPSQGPSPDQVWMTGFKLVGGDGNFLLIDDFDYGSLPDVGEDQLTHPLSSSDLTFTYDFTATYPDGSIHYFNTRGLLIRIANRDGQHVDLDWSIPDPTVYDFAGFRLDAIHAATDGATAGTLTYDRELQFTYSNSSNPRTLTVAERLASTGTGGATTPGRSTVFTFDGNSDLTLIKPARTPSCAASGTASGCVILSYTGSHLLTTIADPRWKQTATTLGPDDLRYEVTWSSSDPMALSDRSQASSTPLLKVLTYDVGGSTLPAARRVAWQDAAGLRATFARYEDLTSDGKAYATYIPLTCTTSCSSGNLPSTSNLANSKATESEFDGLTRVSKTTTYRCPGVAVSGCSGTAEKIVSRQGTKAGAKVNNYNDPLTAGLLEWTQTPDQYVASLRDSGGIDPDLYRTFYAYDENGQQISSARPAHNEQPDYQAAIKSTAVTSVVGYWRLGESSGAGGMVDSSGNSRNGTYTGSPTFNGTGALISDSNKSVAFPSSSYGSVPSATMGTVSGNFSVEAWVKPGTTTGTIVYTGSRNAVGGSSFELVGGTRIHGVIGNGSAYVNSAADATYSYVAGRWYHIVYVLTSGTYTIYANGVAVGGGTFAGSGVLTDATHAFYVGQNGAGTYWNGSIDDVAVYSGALSPQQVEAHYLAGRAIALQTTETQYNQAWKPLQVDDQMLSNAGFESGPIGWDSLSGSMFVATTTSDSRVHQPADLALPRSWQSYSTGTSGSAQQDVQLLPGQTFRVQFWETHASANAANANVTLQYWKRSTAAWTSWSGWSGTFTTGASWVGHAWDVTLPFDTDGRVRLKLGVSGAVSGGTVYYDDAGIFTTYSRTAYTSAGSGTFGGLVADSYAFSPAGAGPDAELRRHSQYDPMAAHPAIFVTKQTANYTGAAFDPATPDRDVSTTTTYDAWGHVLSATDQDGVQTSTAYVSSTSANGYATDVASTSNLMNETTSFQYDVVGHQTRVTTPLGDYTTTEYDLAGHATKVVAPSPVSTTKVSVFDAYGFMTDQIVNWVDGTPSTGLDDVVTSYVYDEFGAQTRTTQNTGVSGTASARTQSLHDLVGNTTSTTSYSTYDGTNFAGARTSTSHVERASDPGGGYAVRQKPSGTRGPGSFAATSGTLCPDGSGLYCNTVTKLDQDGQSIATTDVYSKTTKSLLDLAGKPVITIANFVDGVYADANPDQDLISLAYNDLFGRPSVIVSPRALAADANGRMTTTAYDALGRPTSVTVTSSNGTVGSQTRTKYTGAGRVDLTSLPSAALVSGSPAADSTFTWTKTVYDKTGRATKTLAHFDITGKAGLQLDSFEAPETDNTIQNDGVAEAWTGGTGTFTAGGSINRETAAASAKTGSSRLAVVTGSGASAGTEWALDGTFVTGDPYKARIWVWVPTGTTITAQLGVAADSAQSVAPVSGNNAWQPLDVSWTPSANRTGVKVAVFRSASAATVTFYVDEVAVWDSASNAVDVNVPTETAYDVDGRVVASIVPPGTVGATDVSMVTRTGYDVLGRVTSVTVNEVAGGGTSASDVNLTTQTHYDALGRNDTITDPTGTVTLYEFDRLGRTTKTTLNYEAGSPSSTTTSDDVLSKYAYDAAGELIGYCTANEVAVAGGCDETSPSNAQAWHYAYDDAGHMLLQTPPVKTAASLTQLASTRWEYDAGGRLLRTCDMTAGTASCTAASGVIRTIVPSYDEVGRTVQTDTKTGSATGTLALRTSTKYQGDGQAIETKYSEGSGPTVKDTITYQYDTFGRLTKSLRGTTVLSENTYNTDDTLASRIDGDAPNGSNPAIGTSTYGYDWAKRLTSVTVPTGFSASTTATFGWRIDGLIKSRSWSSGSAAAFAYDAAKRPTELAKGADWIRQTFDRDGNVATESRSLSSVSGDPGTGTQTFSYDALNRVTSSTGLATASNRTYTYDRDGNRLTKVEGGVTTFTATYDRTDQLVKVNKGTGDVNFAYDAMGNMTSNAETAATVTAYTYDAGNKLTAIAGPGGTSDDAAFTFDALGRFLDRTVDTGNSAKIDTYSYVGLSETVLRVSNWTKPNTTTNTDSIVSPNGDRLGVKVGSTVNWLVPDLHGSVAAALSSNEATFVNAIRYDAYGQVIATGSAGGTAVGANNWKYQGKLDISPTSQPLYDMAARFYSPGLGAFTQLDSVMGGAQNPRSMNRFLYAEANPATLIDPTGHMATLFEGGGGISTTTTTTKTTTTTSSTSKASVSDDSRSESASLARASADGAAAQQTAFSEASEGLAISRASAAGAAAQCNFICINPHDVLNVVGMIPVVGTGADLLNAALYASEGDWGNAALSAVSAVPLVGDALGAGRLALKYGDEAVEAAGFVASHVDEAADVIKDVAHFGDEAAEVASDAAKVADDAADVAGGAAKVADEAAGLADDAADAAVSYARPSGYRAGLRDAVWNKAIEPATGRVRDAVTGRFMSKSKPWDMGHLPGHEFRKFANSAESRGISRRQFLDEYNDAAQYRPELPTSNQGHLGELLTNEYWGP